MNILKLKKKIDLRNFNVTCDKIKSHKIQGFTPSLKNTFLEKRQGETGQSDPQPLKGLKCCFIYADSLEYSKVYFNQDTCHFNFNFNSIFAWLLYL